MSTIGSNTWNQRAMNYPNCPAFCPKPEQPKNPQVSTLLAVFAAAAIGAAATAGTILGVQKLIEIKKQKAAEAEAEGETVELEKIEIEGPEAEAQ